MRRFALLGSVLGASLAAMTVRADAAPDVVASIAPIGHIASAVMAGLGEPHVLLEPGASPHAYSLRPSQAGVLGDAELILWVGGQLEVFLARPLAALGGEVPRIELAALPGITLLAYREGALFEAHGHDDEAGGHGHDHDEHDHAGHGHDDEHDHDHGGGHDDDHGHGELDGHLWLSPANARLMALAIAEALAGMDPANAATYRANSDVFAASLDAVEAEIDAILAPVRGRPFIVFHDAYHYFERHFGIEAAGAIHLSPEVQPGAARIAAIRERISELGSACVLAEPQFEPRIIRTVTEGGNVRTGVLDPLGAGIPPGPEAYGQLLLDIATGLAECLAD